jgi:hypothetical protein
MRSLKVTILYEYKGVNTTQKNFFILIISTNMKTIKFFLWLNDQTTKQQEINTVNAYKIAMNMIGSYFGGWTIEEWKGFFKHEDGSIVIENTLIITTATDLDYKDFVEDLKRTFNQESIMIQEINCNTLFK